MPVKVFYIASSPIPSRSANAVHVMKMVQALSKVYETKIILQYTGSDIFDYYGIEKNFEVIKSGIVKTKADLISYCIKSVWHARNSQIIISRNLVATALCCVLGKKTFQEVHDAPESFNPLAKFLFKTIISKKSKLVCISHALAAHLVEWGCDPKNVIVAPDGADPISESGEVPFVKNGFCVGYTGHLYAGRGIELIKAVAEKAPDISFHIVGGNEDDVAAWEKKKAPNMVFHGHVEHHKVGAYLKNFDVLLAPYQQKVSVEGNVGDTSRWMSPLKIFEYMSAGRPLVCSDISVLKEVLKDDHNAILCAPASEAEWLNAILALRADPARAARLASNAKEDFLNNYTWDSRVKTLSKYF